MEGVVAKLNEKLAEQMTGRKAPKEFPVLDASVLEMRETHQILREDVKMNGIRFEFPSGFNKLDLFEECRALTLLDDFEAMYDITMQMLANKDLVVKLRNTNGEFVTVLEAHIVDKFQNLRGYDFIDKYPIVVTWLTEFMQEELAKKYPLPGKILDQPKAAEKSGKSLVRRSPQTTPQS